jgi:hypothetical protein
MYLFKKLLLSFAVVLFTCGTSTVYLYYIVPCVLPVQYTCCTTSTVYMYTQYGRW